MPERRLLFFEVMLLKLRAGIQKVAQQGKYPGGSGQLNMWPRPFAALGILLDARQNDECGFCKKEVY